MEWKEMQQKTAEQDRQRWEAFVAKRLAEHVPEQDVVQELVAKGADLHLARDFVRRVADSQQPEPEPKPEPKEHQRAGKGAVAIDAVIGIALAAAGIVAALLMYVADLRSAGAYIAFAAALVGLALVGRRALRAGS